MNNKSDTNYQPVWITNTLQKFSFGNYSFKDFQPPVIEETSSASNNDVGGFDPEHTDIVKRNEEFNELISHAKDVAKKLQNLVDKSESSFRTISE